jgi:predicted P-loop ATPase
MKKKYNRVLSKAIAEIQNKKLSGIETFKEMVRLFYSFRLNSVTGKIEYSVNGKPEEYSEMTDRALNTVYVEMHSLCKGLPKGDMLAVINSDFSTHFDPLINYFESLEKWDRETDYIDLLGKEVTTDEQKKWSVCFKKWIVALVAGVVDSQKFNHTCLVLLGGQGIGKTTWIERLVPSVLSQYYHCGVIDPRNKDLLIRLSECMLINLDDIDTLRKYELEEFKSVITQSEINLRRPYGTYTEHFRRRASFAATGNNLEILTDYSGNRRFLTFEALTIEREKSVPIDSVYAQAYALFKDGFRYWFDREDIGKLEVSNERFRKVSICEEKLAEIFLPGSTEKYDEAYSATEICERVMSVPGRVDNSMVQEMGRVLNRHKFPTRKVGGSKKYLVVFKSGEDSETTGSGSATD